MILQYVKISNLPVKTDSFGKKIDSSTKQKFEMKDLFLSSAPVVQKLTSLSQG